MADTQEYVTVEPGDRIDLIANRVYGDPYQYRTLLDANPHLDMWNPQPGKVIEVPSAE